MRKKSESPDALDQVAKNTSYFSRRRDENVVDILHEKEV